MHKHLITSLLLAAACAGCASHHKQYTMATSMPRHDVAVLTDSSTTSSTLAAAMPQFSSGTAPILLPNRQPVNSPMAAVPELEHISNRPLLAVTEYKDWFWYATDVDRDPQTQAIRSFNGGYAVQKGGYLAWKWGSE
jgi:hypothetical protein